MIKLSNFRTFAIFISILILLSCQNTKPATNSPGDTFIIGEVYAPTKINPILTSGSSADRIVTFIFDGLIKTDLEGNIYPSLASSYKVSGDGLWYTFSLKKGVKFHDGLELTAEDVKFTYDKIKEGDKESMYSSIFEMVETITVRDKYTIDIFLKRPFASIYYGLMVGILPKHILKETDVVHSPFNYNPIGTGPFKLTKYERDEIIVEANNNYFKGRPYLDRIAVKTFPNEEILWAKLMNGEIDLLCYITPEKYSIIREIPEIKTYTFLNPYYYIVAINRGKEIFISREIIKALNLAIDKEGLLKQVLKGKGVVSSGTIYPLSWANNNDIKPYPYDPIEALNLLKKNGWEDRDGDHIIDKNGKKFEFPLCIPEGDELKVTTAMYIQQQLLDLGIRVVIKQVISSQLEQLLFKKEFDAVLIDIISDDPDKNYIVLHSSQIDKGFNVFAYRNPEVDRLLDEGRAALDKEKRKEIYFKLQEVMHEDPPGIFLFWRKYLVAIHKRFKNVQISEAGVLWNINEWYVPKEEQKYTGKTTH